MRAPSIPGPYRLSRRCITWLWPCLLLMLASCASRAQPVASAELRFEGQLYRVVTLDLRRERLDLHWRSADDGQAFGSIEALRQWGGKHGRRLLFATNAGIYDRAARPLGLHVEDGATRVPLNLARGNPAAGNFSIAPNGVFAVLADGRAEVLTSAAFDRQAPAVRLASQSGPMLVIAGAINPAFLADSTSYKWRSGVCAKTPHQVLFAVSESPVNFHAFARLFRDRLGCRDALYLDGSISQLYVDGAGYAGAPTFLLKPYVGIFAVWDSGDGIRD